MLNSHNFNVALLGWKMDSRYLGNKMDFRHRLRKSGLVPRPQALEDSDEKEPIEVGEWLEELSFG